jgi:hypothetical protein
MKESDFVRKSENEQEKKDEPKGHPPIRYEDGQYICPERGRVRPEFPIGKEEYHRRLFIEYERTFGRGWAKYITHGGGQYIPGTESEKKFNESYGEKAIEEYRELQNTIPLMNLGTKKQCEEAIAKIIEYRRKHPGLYADVVDPNAPKKKFEILEIK